MVDQQARLSEITARVEAATAGPWRSRVNGQKPYKHVAFSAHRDEMYTTSPLDAGDSDFIAHAREDVPYLLAEVARLRGALEDIAMDIESDSRARPWLLEKVRAALNPIPVEEAK